MLGLVSWLATAMLLATSCGSGASLGGVETTAVVVSSTTVVDTSAVADTTVVSDSTVVGEAEQELAAAFSQTVGITRYTMKQFNAQQLRSSALGVNSHFVINPLNPTLVSEVDGTRSHTIVDIGELLGPLASDLGSILVEMWADEDSLVIDTRDYQTILDLNPTTDLGPFEPGVASIDIGSLAVDSPKVFAAIAGNAAPDLGLLANTLPAALTDIRELETYLPTKWYVGAASFSNFTEAMGGDINVTAGSAAAGAALNLDLDAKDLAAIYVAFYDETPVEVTIGLDTEGRIAVIETRIDMSGIYAFLFSDENAAVLGFPLNELTQARDAFEDTVWILESLVKFDIDHELVVENPPEATEDRTAQWEEFLINAGVLPG